MKIKKNYMNMKRGGMGREVVIPLVGSRDVLQAEYGRLVQSVGGGRGRGRRTGDGRGTGPPEERGGCILIHVGRRTQQQRVRTGTASAKTLLVADGRGRCGADECHRVLDRALWSKERVRHANASVAAGPVSTPARSNNGVQPLDRGDEPPMTDHNGSWIP